MTTEAATFFGPTDTPLFGVLHLPDDGRARDAVVICGSLGKEAADSIRLQRILATRLARRGFAVLRFDYLCTGDSALPQDAADAAGLWTASIGHAIDYLRDAGLAPGSVIALRAGALTLHTYLRDTGYAFERVVLLDPVTDGRRFVREQTMLLRMAVETDPTTAADTVPILGARLHAEAAEALGKYRLSALPAEHQMVVTRPGASGAAFAPGVRRVVGRLLVESTQSAEMVVPVALQAADTITDWLDGAAPSRRRPLRPEYRRTAAIPVCGGWVREQIEYVGTAGLFAIRTTAAAPSANAVTAVFCNTANDRHTGPAREWVELARQVALAGGQALRWDRTGCGDSPPIVSRQWRRIYSRTAVRDVIAATRHADTDPANVRVVGVCSGAWQAAHAGRAGTARRVLLANPIVWNWRVRSTWSWEWNARRLLRDTCAGSDAADSAGRQPPNRLSRFIDTTRPVRSKVARSARKRTPTAMRTVAGHLGFGFVPRVVLDVLAKRGVSTTVLLAPEDAEFFDRRGGAASLLRHRGAAATPSVLRLREGDHAAHHPAVVSAIRDEVLGWFQPQAATVIPGPAVCALDRC